MAAELTKEQFDELWLYMISGFRIKGIRWIRDLARAGGVCCSMYEAVEFAKRVDDGKERFRLALKTKFQIVVPGSNVFEFRNCLYGSIVCPCGAEIAHGDSMEETIVELQEHLQSDQHCEPGNCPHCETFQAYFNIADELEGGLTLQDLDEQERHKAGRASDIWPGYLSDIPRLADAEELALEFKREGERRWFKHNPYRVG